MKFKTLFILTAISSVFFSSCNSDDVTEIGNWVEKAFYEAYARAEGSSFEIDNYGYWGMGRDIDGYLTDFWKFDPTKGEKGAWTQVAEFPGTARAYNVSVSTESKGYVGLGYDGENDLADFWEYDPSTNSWDSIVAFVGGERRYATAFSIGNDIYVGTGTKESDKVYTNDFYKFDGSSWTKVASLTGEKRRQANATSLDGKGYLLSGFHNSVLQDFYRYDPATDTWEELSDLNDEDTGDSEIARYNACFFAANGKLYLTVGNQGGITETSTFEWDPSDVSWTKKTSLESGISREGAGTFVLNDQGYIVGGRSGSSYFDDCYMFEPDKDKDSDD